MAKSTTGSESKILVPWGNIHLEQSVVSALEVFQSTPRNRARDTEWYAMCMAGQHALAFFKGPNKSREAFRITASNLVADAYEDLRDGTDAAVIRPASVAKVRDHAKAMRATLPPARYLPIVVNTRDFRSGLDALCKLTMPVTAPTSNSGDVCARTFTLSLAKKFAKAFLEIPVEYIHSLVTFGWPSRSLSATWRVLDASVTERIKREAEAEVAQEASAQSTTALVIHAASTTRHAMSELESDTVDQLQHEIDRLRQGKRRFPTDAAGLRALRNIAQGLDNRALGADLVAICDSHLGEFID